MVTNVWKENGWNSTIKYNLQKYSLQDPNHTNGTYQTLNIIPFH
jgi:hypothetical protein